jgi:glyoxalase family protein
VTPPIPSLHHVTATVDAAQPDVDFYARLLGLRLVKRTVNFDNHSVWHFYYGDERGTPGTIWTTFPYHGHGVPAGVHGAGQITATAFSVPPGSLGWWAERLRARGVTASLRGPLLGEPALGCLDPSGLVIELVEADDPRAPWTGGGVDAATAIRGIRGVTLTVHDAGPTEAFLAEVLGFVPLGREGDVARLGVAGGGPGRTLDVRAAPDAPRARNGLGTVHHVALAIDGEDAQRALREELVRQGVHVTPVLDRQYFRSIYFREPGGVLLEVATLAPGFTVDEPLGSLGSELRLPPWEESNRAAIEAALPPVR